MGQTWGKFFNSGQSVCAEQQSHFGGVAASILVDMYIFSMVSTHDESLLVPSANVGKYFRSIARPSAHLYKQHN